ncbi:CopG family ribbon-helix-helix protein [Klebsiella pneumoniae]|uniref:CopG family ribbon-helix-helix protein n=1 Tax=Klebsiella pneumoniae TaxID=573 RepID=UPI003F883E10
MSSATSIRLDEELKDRLKTLADDRHRSAHALMLEAITEYIDREEKRSQYLRTDRPHGSTIRKRVCTLLRKKRKPG